jgi:hypothetical protein
MASISSSAIHGRNTLSGFRVKASQLTPLILRLLTGYPQRLSLCRRDGDGQRRRQLES